MEKTLGIIKPDAVDRNLIGKILERIESAGLKICALKILTLSRREAESFYKVHIERPFFADLTAYMTSSPVVPVVIQGDNAIKKWREIMGATNPAEADKGTIRRDFAIDIEKNSVHGSDSPESATEEIPFFFGNIEIRS